MSLETNTKLKSKRLQYKREGDYYYGGTPFRVTVTKKRKELKKPYRWVSPKGAGNMTVMPGDPEMVFFTPILAGAGIAASPAITSAAGSAISGINTAGDALAATAAGQRLTSGLNFTANAIGRSKAWPWINTGLTSIFGAQGADKIRRGDIHNVGDVVQTGLDLLPLSQLVRPVVSTVGRIGSAVGNISRRTPKPSYLLFDENAMYRVIGDEGYLDALTTGILRPNMNPNSKYYRGLNKTWNWYTKGYPNDTYHPVTFANGKHPIDARYPGNIIVEVSPQHPQFDSFVPHLLDAHIYKTHTFFDVNSPYIKFYKKVKNGKYLLIDNPLYNTTPKGLSEEPLIARSVPEVTVENAASITPEQWTAAQDAAIARGDMAEAQRLRDLHFGNNPVIQYRGHPSKTNTPVSFGENQPIFTTTSKTGAGHYGIVEPYYMKIANPRTLDYHGKEYDAKILDDLYSPGLSFTALDRKANKARTLGHDALIVKNVKDGTDYPIDDFIGLNPRKIKSADAVTFDDNGVRIPLGERDNFKLNDIRYSWLAPVIGLGTLGTSLYSRENKFKQGGMFLYLKSGNKIHIKKENRGKFTDYCGGQVTSACILRGKNSSNPAVRKRATFAANARKWKHQEGGILKGQWGTPVDNTRVVGSDGMTAGLRVQMQEQLLRAKAIRARYLEELRLRNQPLLRTAEEQTNSNRIKAEKERNEWLYKNLHLWNIDPTLKVTRNNVQFAFNNAGLAGEPIRLGLGLALGAGAIRQIPSAGKFIYNGAKNEAGMLTKSITTAQGRQMWGQAASNFGKAVIDPKLWNIGKNWVGNMAFLLGKAELYGDVTGGLFLGLLGKPLDGSLTPEELKEADIVAKDSIDAWFDDLDPNSHYTIQ